MIAGTALVIWLADQITRHGLGSGVWLLYLAPLLADLPSWFAALASWQGGSGLLAIELVLAGGFSVLMLAAIVALMQADGSSPATAATCLWSVFLAGAIWPWIVLGLALVAGGGSPQPADWLSPSHPLALALLAALVAAFAYLYARSRRLGGDTAPAVPVSVIAIGLVAIMLASLSIQAFLARLLPLGAPLIVIAAVGLAILGRWRDSASSSGRPA